MTTLSTFIYLIQPGDTLNAIAERFVTTVAILLDLNPQITDPNLIIAGEEMLVPRADTGGGSGTVPNPVVNTHPNCGACGYNVARFNVTSGYLCDSCGADLRAFGMDRSLNGLTGTVTQPGVWDGWAPRSIDDANADPRVVGQPFTPWENGVWIMSGDQHQEMHWDGVEFVPGRAPNA
jgi:hypothetical protein